ncbi:MAG: hypothetical protein IJ796_07725 [Lachnospiraceae bacterium]|nr:hypothetical protein [Lachnospiraceae bacterium]
MPGPQKKDFEKIYQNPLWQTQAKEFEQSFARRLYDDTQVRSAGRVALSKMSRLLVRYNRLQKADEEGADFASYKYAKEMQRHMAALDRIKNRKEEGLEKFTEENSKEREDFLKKIEDEQNEEEKGHKVELANIEKMKNAGKKMSLNTQLDNDRNGRIRSRLLLGGNAQGARDFSLTEGDEIEQRIAGNYISDISGENGNLFDQMSLFDNAVNSKGIEDEEGPELKSFNEIMTGMTEKDLEQMNSGKDDEKVEVDINALNEARKNNNLSELIGDGGEKKNIEEALESRGSQKAVKRAQRFKQAAINKIKADYNAGINRQRTASGRGLFGKLGRAFSVKEKRYKGFTDVFGRSYSREDARRIDMRRKSLEYRLMIAKTRTEKKDYSKVSDEDTSARLDER